MKLRYFGIVFLALLCTAKLGAQIAADCQTAIPICSNTPINSGTQGYGIDDFGGAVDSGCLEATLSGFIESNSAWYRFRTGASGQLGFNIGFDASEDWDFALYRASDCNSLGDPVRCNFFDNQEGRSFMGVGEDPSGVENTYQYEPWLDVNPGEDYYLLINNFSNTNSGFTIQFSGNIFVTNPFDALDCSIISNLLGPPIAACQGDVISLDATLTDAVAYEWFLDSGSGFQSLIGEVSPTLNVTSDGLYRVRVATSGGNQIISDVQVGFAAIPSPQPMTDLVVCDEGGSYDLSLKNTEVLGVLPASEYRVSYYLSLTDAQNDSQALPYDFPTTPGTETIYVRISSMGNPDCYDASASFELNVLQTPVLNFEEEVWICAEGSLQTIGELNPSPGTDYLWDSGETTPSLNVTASGTYTLTATNSQNGASCSNSRTVVVTVSTAPSIDELLVSDLSENNSITVVSNATGNFEYALDDGAFQASNIFEGVSPGNHLIRMRDFLGCGEVSENVVVVGVLPFFTPNGDGMHDLWTLEGMEQLQEPVISIFDRYGKLLKQLNMQDPYWDGTFQGKPLPATDYWYVLSHLNPDGRRVEAKYLNNHFSLKR